MVEPISLAKARKVRDRVAAKAQAAENRVRFGRTKADKAVRRRRGRPLRPDAGRSAAGRVKPRVRTNPDVLEFAPYSFARRQPGARGAAAAKVGGRALSARGRSMTGRILVVEDDAATADFVVKGLERAGFSVRHAADGRTGLHLASAVDVFDVVVIDRMLPELDGLSVVKALRACDVETPILILSALGELDEKVNGLRAGADDYLTKPFGFSELHARVENLLRRRPTRAVETVLRCGDLSMDLLSRKVTRGGRPLDLLPRGFKLLEYLVAPPRPGGDAHHAAGAGVGVSLRPPHLDHRHAHQPSAQEAGRGVRHAAAAHPARRRLSAGRGLRPPRPWLRWVRPQTGGRLAPQAFLLFAVALVLLASAVALVMVYGSGQRIISAREMAQAEAERDLLLEIANEEGRDQAAAAVERRSRFAVAGERYGLFDAAGKALAGDLARDEPAFHDVHWRATPLASAEGGAVHTVAARLPDGTSLVIGRDLSELRSFERSIFAGFAASLLIVASAGVAAGLLLNAQILSRVNAIAHTAERIAAGDLSARAPLADRRDPFGRVGASLNAMLGRIEELMTGMRTVTDSLAHDLRSPLTRMKGALDRALRLDLPEPERLDAIEAAGIEADRTLATLSALLDIARAETGLSREMMRPVDVTALVAEVAEVFAPVLEDAGQWLNLDEGSDPVMVRGHEALLRQAAGNLLHNASQHAGEGARVRVAVTRAPGVVRIMVSDTGPGVPHELHGRVQERFVRIDQARSGAGAGLGLAIVAACAKLHGGALRLTDNAPGLAATLEIAAG